MQSEMPKRENGYDFYLRTAFLYVELIMITKKITSQHCRIPC